MNHHQQQMRIVKSHLGLEGNHLGGKKMTFMSKTLSHNQGGSEEHPNSISSKNNNVDELKH